jgi:hypothetical protein
LLKRNSRTFARNTALYAIRTIGRSITLQPGDIIATRRSMLASVSNRRATSTGR